MIENFKPRTIIGIDPSTKSGLVCLVDGVLVETLQIKTEANTPVVGRALIILAQVGEFLDKHKPDLVVLEDYGLRNKFNLVLMVTIGSSIRMAVYQRGIPWYDLAPTALKKWLTGKGVAEKKVMMAHVARRWGFITKCDDIADAFALAKYGHAMFIEESREIDWARFFCNQLQN